MKLSQERLKQLIPDLVFNKRGSYGIGTCPSCNSKSEFSISTSAGHVGGCNRKAACGFRCNIFILAKLLNRWDLLNLEGEVGLVEKLENIILKYREEEIFPDLPEVKMPLGFQRSLNDEYLNTRNFSEYEYKKYTVGRTVIEPRLKNNYAIIAVEDEGKIKGYLARHIWSKKQIDAENEKRNKTGLREIRRWLNSETDFGALLFGYDDIIQGETKTIIAVESAFGVVNINQLLKLNEQVKKEVVCNATFKAGVTGTQLMKWAMKGIETVILMYDSDVIEIIKRTAAELQLHFNVLIAFIEDANGIDSADIDEAGLSKVLNNLKKVSDFTSGKVSNKLKIA